MALLQQIGGQIWTWITGTSTIPKSTARSGPRSYALETSVAFRPISELGPHCLELFDRLHDLYFENESASDNIADCERALSKLQYDHDIALCDRSRIENDQRADFSSYLGSLANLKNAQAAEELNLAGFRADRDRFTSQSDRAWAELFKVAQEYMNCCLDVLFEAEWCLDPGSCHNLRELLDSHVLLQERQTELRDLRLTRAWSRLESGGPDGGEQIARLQTTIERMKRAQKSMKRELIEAVFAPLLSRVRERYQASSAAFIRGSSDDSNEGSPSSARSSHDDDQQNRSERSDSSDEGEEYILANPDRLRRQYQEALSHLSRLQGYLQRHENRWRDTELEHLMTFPRSSKFRFETLVNYLVKDLKNDIKIAQDKLQSTVDQLLDNDIELPATPPPKEQTDRSLYPDSDSDYELELEAPTVTQWSRESDRRAFYEDMAKRRRINRWRTLLKPAVFGMQPASPPQGQDRLVVDGPSPLPSPQAPPSSGRKRKREEYRQQQQQGSRSSSRTTKRPGTR